MAELLTTITISCVQDAPRTAEPPSSGAASRAAGVVTLRATENIAAATRAGAAQDAVQFLPQVAAMRSFEALNLGSNEYFMTGDNRDNSGDSRYFGPVARSALIGRARMVLFSVDIFDHWSPRMARILHTL